MEIEDVTTVIDRGHTVDGAIVPAHGIGGVRFPSRSGRGGGCMQRRNPLWREDSRAAIASIVHLSEEIVGHIFGAGDEVAIRKFGTGVWFIIRKRRPEPPGIALSQSVPHGVLLRGVAVVHL